MWIYFVFLLHHWICPTTSKISELSCTKPAAQTFEGTILSVITPDKATSAVFEKFTVKCVSNTFLGIGVDPVMQCNPNADGTLGVLSPVSPPQCQKSDDGRQNQFPEEVAASPSSYVISDDYGCMVREDGLKDGKKVYKAAECESPFVTQIEFGCKTDTNVFIGYPALKKDDGKFGQDILSDSNLKIKLGCAPKASTKVCADVHSSQSSQLSASKLYVELRAKPEKAKSMIIEEGDTTIKYKFRCADGYNFQHAINDKAVYGYCSTSGETDSTKNEYTVTELNKTDRLLCYSICPANPASTSFTSTVSFTKVYAPELRKDQTAEITHDYILCPDGKDLAEDAPAKFTVTCNGAAVTEAPRSGKLACSTCPSCHQVCAENPVAANIKDESHALLPNLESITITGVTKFNKVLTVPAANVKCSTNYGLAEGTANTYQITCAAAGVYKCTTCPSCQMMCPMNPDSSKITMPAEGNIDSLKINTATNFGKILKVAKADVVCKSGYALADSDPAEFTFTCGASGMYSCTICPSCKGNCEWPDMTDKGLDFKYVNPDKKRVKGEKAYPGSGHVEAFCTDKSLTLLGPRFLSCSKVTTKSKLERRKKRSGAKANSLTFDTDGFKDTETTCQNAQVCTIPKLIEAMADKTGNILEGDSYVVKCNPKRIFDMKTKEALNSFDTVTLPCTAPTEKDAMINDKLSPVTCYDGCKPISEFKGTATPDIVESGQAPYSDGTVITFTCHQGYHLSENDKNQVCKDGSIPIPKCGKAPKPTTQPGPNSSYRTIVSINLLMFVQFIMVQWQLDCLPN